VDVLIASESFASPFAKQYGFFRFYVKMVIYRYLDCGILHNGFARVRRKDCGHEYLLAFSCKHCHFIFRIPKILRRYFLYDRRLLFELSRCAWDSLKVFFTTIVPEEDAVPGAAIAIQTFGDFLGFHSHCHVLCTNGGFYGKGMFRVAPWFIPKDLEKLSRYKVFKMVLSRKEITEDLMDMMIGWRHSGFIVYCGPRIQPGDEEAFENLALYIIRASFSDERMAYILEESKVLYRSKDGKKENIFDALEWLVAMPACA
jgi:hypothetical protein